MFQSYLTRCNGYIYTLDFFYIDPEKHQLLVETNLPTPMTARVELLNYQRICLVVGNIFYFPIFWEVHHPN